MLKTILILLMVLLIGCASEASDINAIDSFSSIVEETTDDQRDSVSPTGVLVGIIVVLITIVSFIVGYLKHAQHEVNFWKPFRKERDDGGS